MSYTTQHSHTAVIIAGHGASENTDSALPALRHAARLRCTNLFAQVHTGFWKQKPHITDVFNEALSSSQIREIIVLPFFLAEGYFSQKVIPEALGITLPVCELSGKRIIYSNIPGTSPLLANVLARRARRIAAVSGLEPSRSVLILVGHGTDRHPNTGDTLHLQLAAIREMGVFAECHPAFMEMAPFVADWHSITNLDQVVVVPFFIANGLHAYEDIPVLLGITQKVDTSLPRSHIYNPRGHKLRGRQLWYCPSIGYEAEMTSVLLDCALRAITEHAQASALHCV